MPTPRNTSRSPASCWSVAAAIACSGGVRGCNARTPVPRPTGRATRLAAAAQREAAAPGDDTAVLDAHQPAVLPLGHRHPVGQVERSDLRHAVECRTDATGLRTDEADGVRLGHPVDVTLDRFHGPPRVGRRRVDRDRDLDLHQTARNAAAASAGATMFTDRPVASSKPAYTVTRGTTSTHHWNGSAWARGAVPITTVYATSPSAHRRRAVAPR